MPKNNGSRAVPISKDFSSRSGARPYPLEKSCTKCGRLLPLSEFHKHPQGRYGLHAQCKHCRKVIAQEYVAQRSPEMSARHKQQSREWKARNPIRATAYIYKHRKLHPVRALARSRVTRAIASGELSPQPCCLCGATPGQAHHRDYTRPLEIVWLCRPCHIALHNNRHLPSRAWRVPTIRGLQ